MATNVTSTATTTDTTQCSKSSQGSSDKEGVSESGFEGPYGIGGQCGRSESTTSAKHVVTTTGHDSLITRVSTTSLRLARLTTLWSDLNLATLIVTTASLPSSLALNLPTQTTPSTFARLFHLSPAALAILTTPNAGGDSILSESLSEEVLCRTLFKGAKLLATEMEVQYFPMGGSMTDYVLRVPFTTKKTVTWKNVAVSVTRAFKYTALDKTSSGVCYTVDDALKLVRKKLTGVVYAGRNMYISKTVLGTEGNSEIDKHVLHVFVPDGHTAKMVRLAYKKIRKGEARWTEAEKEDMGVIANTLVVVTVCNVRAIYSKSRRSKETAGQNSYLGVSAKL
ncbi:hypothetical protein HDV05_001101 [Chytridiales sp. JEL 0842]|nr:hypothetical protein HDV05_001101 [Chytridiales sp. JEL 0842]